MEMGYPLVRHLRIHENIVAGQLFNLLTLCLSVTFEIRKSGDPESPPCARMTNFKNTGWAQRSVASLFPVYYLLSICRE
jgi:hypothetical protein